LFALLGGVDFVGFGLAAVDGLHGQGVAEDKWNVLGGAEVSEPIPGEHALDAGHQSVVKRLDGVEEGVGPSRQVLVEADAAFGFKDVEVVGPRMQIDADVRSVLVGIESPGCVCPRGDGPT
jgi:hypothetical protein